MLMSKLMNLFLHFNKNVHLFSKIKANHLDTADFTEKNGGDI